MAVEFRHIDGFKLYGTGDFLGVSELAFKAPFVRANDGDCWHDDAV